MPLAVCAATAYHRNSSLGHRCNGGGSSVEPPHQHAPPQQHATLQREYNSNATLQQREVTAASVTQRRERDHMAVNHLACIPQYTLATNAAAYHPQQHEPPQPVCATTTTSPA
jgi:hypothetical protein